MLSNPASESLSPLMYVCVLYSGPFLFLSKEAFVCSPVLSLLHHHCYHASIHTCSICLQRRKHGQELSRADKEVWGEDNSQGLNQKQPLRVSENYFSNAKVLFAVKFLKISSSTRREIMISN